MAWVLRRRDFLKLSASAVLVGCGAPCPRGDPIFEPLEPPAGSMPDLSAEPFSIGVASGDPLEDRVILWTRLAPDPLATDGGMPNQDVTATFEVAKDPEFTEVISQGVVEAAAARGHAIHVDAVGLEAGTTYYYRFGYGDSKSPVGRTKTLPCAEQEQESFRMAWASCQRYRAGHFTAQRHLAQEDLDLVVFLGDYMYESSSNSGVRANEVEMVRAEDLAGFRQRYAFYRTDLDLQASHAAFPWVVIWDDHEVENNYGGDYSARGRSAAEITSIRMQGYQAFFESMPIRAIGGQQLYRRFPLGNLGVIHALDTRQYRDNPACGGEFGSVCDERNDTSRSMLGAEQNRWLFDGMRSHPGWNVLAQSVVMGNLDFDNTVANYDQWDGFTHNRQQIIDVAKEVSDVVVLSGDIHAAGVADLTFDALNIGTRPVATELITTSITSGAGENSVLGEVIANQPHVRYGNGNVRGYMKAELTPTEMRVELRAVDTVLEADSGVRTEASFVIQQGKAGAEPV